MQTQTEMAGGARFDQSSFAQLESTLPAFLAERRWFRSKARAIQIVTVEDVIPLSEIASAILILNVSYADGEADHYLLPVSIAQGTPEQAEEIVGQIETARGGATIYGALSNSAFRDLLLDAIRGERRFAGSHGELVASRTSVLKDAQDGAAAHIESFVSRAEQSNTSIIYRDRYILKLFRKIEPGVNPDVEIGSFLTERGFKYTPAVLGAIEYRASTGEAYSAGILQEFVPNQGDAWKYTLEELEEYFAQALASEMPDEARERNVHPLEMAEHDVPEQARNLIGGYLDSARLLGKRTAEMHAALASGQGAADFEPEPFRQEDAERLYEEMLGQARATFDLLRTKQPEMEGEPAADALGLLDLQDHVMQRFSLLRERPIQAHRIRYHGDYHLGQVLYTGSDFMIIDFEGEPARPLAHRRGKTLAMRDVAGMIRSFQYAAYAALFGQLPGVRTDRESARKVAAAAGVWTTWVNAAFLKSYFDEAGGGLFVPADKEQRRILFDAFLLQKALYEVAYELNNRPKWVAIPLHGILSLVS